MNFLDGQYHFDFLHHVSRPPASSEHNRCPSCDAHHPGPYDIDNTCIYSIIRKNIAYTHGHGWMKFNLCRSVHKLHIPYLDIWVWAFLTWKQAAT